ncbi:MAG: GNAT family N-acetyltransferase, partial [Oscillospiraceae bacterium]
MNSNYILNPIRDNAALAQRAAEWFNAKWGVPVEAYLDSMNECIGKPCAEVQWYVLTDEDRIIAGMGVIENDFHDRKDLAPNICAVYTEEEYRGRGIAKYLLDYVCADLSRLGTDTLYLITNHDDFYEKCGFEHYCSVKEDNGHTAKLYRRISRCGESMGALKSFLDSNGRLTALPAK